MAETSNNIFGGDGSDSDLNSDSQSNHELKHDLKDISIQKRNEWNTINAIKLH
jgi:hypothetical protein